MFGDTIDILITTPYFDQDISSDAVPRTVRSTLPGPSLLKSYLNAADISNEIIDPYGSRLDFDATMEYIQAYDTNIYGISATFITYSRLKTMCVAIKEHNPDAKIIVGGWGSFEYFDLLMGIHEIDYVVVGRGETITPRLVNAIKSKDDGLLRSTPGVAYRDHEGLPVFVNGIIEFPEPDDLLLPDISNTPPFRLYDSSNLIVNYYSSMGCYNRCTFCTIGLMHESYSVKSASRVASDLGAYAEMYPGLSKVVLSDDLFNMGRLPGIVSELEMRELALSFVFQTATRNVIAHEDLVMDPRLDGYIERIDFGLETFNGNRLRLFSKPTTPEENWHAVDILAERRRRTGKESLAYLILDDQVSDVKRHWRRYTDGKFWPMNFWMNSLVVFPQTKLAQMDYSRKRLAWQYAFHKLMKPFHDRRRKLVRTADFYADVLRRDDPRELDDFQRSMYYKFADRQERMWRFANSMVEQHFLETLDIADMVERGILDPRGEDVGRKVIEFEDYLNKGILHMGDIIHFDQSRVRRRVA